MSNQNFTWEEIKNKINDELDIAVLLDTIFEKKLYHSDAPINEFLKTEEVEFDFDVKTNYTFVTCPLHETKNADSTYYYHDKNEFFCEVGGCRSHAKPLNPINLYMVLAKNVSPDLLFESAEEFKEAVKELAEMIGIKGWSYGTRTLTDEERKELRKQKIRQEVCEIYHKEFMKKNDWAKKARRFFFYERGFGQLGFSVRSLIRSQKLGYAGGKYGTKFIYNIMKKRGYTDDELLHSGVVQYKKSYDKTSNKTVVTKDIIDFLTNRMTIPYHKGKKIDHGYGRRIEFKEELEKMYKTMTEDQIRKSKKGKHLRFGGGVDEPINFQEARKYESIIVVEGEMDYLTFLALGFKNVIAVGGTNGVSKADIDLLKYHREKSNRSICNSIYLCFDEDGPGQAAMQKLGAAFLEAEFDTRVVRLVEGDPNDYLKKYGSKAKEFLAELLDNAVTFEAFAILHIMKKAKLKTNADIRGALIKVKDHMSRIGKDERLFIAYDICDVINEQRPENRKIPIEWLLHTWDLVPNEASVEPKGFEQAILKPWVMITEDEDRYEALLANGTLENVIFVPDMNRFIAKIKQQPHIKNIAIDGYLSNPSKQMLFSELEDYKYQEFQCDSVDVIKSATKYELISMFRKLDVPDLKVS